MVNERQLSLGQVIDLARPQFQEIVRGMPAVHRLNYEAEQRFAIQHLQANDYLLKVARECPESLQSALCNLAGIGLSLNPAEKLAYLIPRNVKVGTNSQGRNQYQTRIFADVGYMGLVRLATDSGSILWCQARIVYANDAEFLDCGPGEKPIHKYDARVPLTDRGEAQCVYSVAKTSGGDYLTTIIPVDKINEIRDRTESFRAAAKSGRAPSGPWVTDWEEQAKKTVIRNAFKTWPRSTQGAIMARAVEISNDNMGFVPLLESSPQTSNYTAEEKEFFDALIEDDDHLGMYVLRETTSPGAFANLYNSFEKGGITKYKRLVDELLSRGESTFADYALMVGEANESGDDLALTQAREEVSDAVWDLIEERT